jgi:hypothetical protein
MGDRQVIPPPPGLLSWDEEDELREGFPAPEGPAEIQGIAEPPGLVKEGPELGSGLSELRQKAADFRRLEDSISGLPDPEEERAGIENSLYFSHSLDISPEQAYQLKDQIAGELTGEETKQKTFWQKFTENVRTAGSILRSVPQSAQAGMKAGLLQEKLYEEAFQLSVEALAGSWNQERYNRITELQQQLHSLAPNEETDFLNQVIWDVGQIVPGMIQGMGEGALYGVGTAALGAATGTVVPGVGTLTAAGGGFLFGFTAGMASHSFRQMRGKSWLTLSQMRDEEGNPMPQSIVQVVSFTAGVLNAAIEVGQMGALIKTVPGASKLLRDSVGNAFDEAVKDGTLRSAILRRIGEYGRYWTEEVSEELAQELVDIISEHVAMDLSDLLTARKALPRYRGAPTQFEHSTVIEDYRRLVDTFIHSAPAMAILGLPGNVAGTVQDIAATQAQIEQQIEERVELPPEEEKLLQTLSEGLTVETPTAETELGRRLARASRERIAPAPVNERLEIAEEIEDTYERDRVLCGEIAISEVLETEVQEEAAPETELTEEQALRRDARRFETAAEFLEYVYSMLLTKEDMAEMGDKPLLDQRLREFWASCQEEPEVEAAPVIEGPIPSIEESRKAFLERYSTPESVEVFLSTLGAKTQKKGSRKGLSFVWWAGASRGRPASSEGWARMRKEMENNPDKFRKVFAEVLEDTEELQLMEEQERRAREAEKEPAMIPEEQAVELAMKKAKQAARKAYTAGKKAGIKAERERKAELLRRKSEKKKLRAYINKLAAQIAKEPGLGIDFYYREAIESLQAGIDPHFRQRKTLESRERIRRFISEEPSRKEMIPKKVRDILQKRSLNEITIAELETLRNEIDMLRKIGRTKYQTKKIQYDRDIREQRDRLAETVLRGEKVKEEPKPIIKSTVEEGKIKRAGRTFRALTLRPPRMFDKLDGGKGFKGEWHKTFVDEVNEQENEKLRAVDDRLEPGKKKRKELGISLADLAKDKVAVEGYTYTLDEALDIYAGFRNDAKKLAIIYGNNIDEKTAEKIIASLTDKEKALADYIIEDYESRYDALRQSHIAQTNRDLGYEENYTPIRRRELDYSVFKEELVDEFERREHLKRAYTRREFTIRRQDIPPEFQKPVRLGLVSTWFGQVPKQEHYIAYGQKIRDLHNLLRDKQVRKAIEQRFGREYVDAVEHYVNRVADPTIYKSFAKWERVSQTLRQNTALAYLGFNIVTMAKQIPSVFLYLPDAGPGHLVGSALGFATRPFEMMRFVNERDPQVKHASIEREMEELKRQDSGLYNRIIKKVGKVGMIGIYAMDKVARTIGWKAVYEANIKKGLSEAEAIREAQNVTLRTQPAARAKDVAELYAKHEAWNWLLQFTNQLSQLYNIATYDIPQTFKQHQYYKGLLQLTAYSITALSIWAISNRRLPEDWKEVAQAHFQQFINSIPVVGRGLVARAEGWFADVTPAPLKAVIEMGTWLKDTDWVRKHPVDWFTDRRFISKINKTLEALAIWSGIPYTGPKRIKKAIEKGEVRELIGGPPKR